MQEGESERKTLLEMSTWASAQGVAPFLWTETHLSAIHLWIIRNVQKFIYFSQRGIKVDLIVTRTPQKNKNYLKKNFFELEKEIIKLNI